MRSPKKWWSGLLLLLLTSVIPLQAQRSQLKPLEVRIGGGGGVSGSMLDLVPRVEMLPHLGAMGYVAVLLTNQNYTGMTMRLSYEQRGWREEYTKPIAYNFARDMDFIDLTLMAHLYYPFGNFQLGLEVGPNVGYIIRDVSSPTPSEETRAVVKRRHVYPLFSKFSWGLKGGPVLSLDIAEKHRITLSGHFYYGLSDLFATTVRDDYGRAGELGVTMGLGYYFRVL
ncbi:porin family protein [uncultured Porphyromonas sp.]|uniref:porin family protein n=1 Tax=uncultured Porphyromonas sp. TaxID=159274 RepID=UPI002604AAD8|nr:porin family protein [uncultured Porphyromonas sp.]